jgi:hypothetical protein
MCSHGLGPSGLVLLLAITACSNDVKPKAGGETHWLLACVSDDDCGDENLTCVCGTCTRACSGSDACAVRGGPAAACFDTKSPLLLQRCEDRAAELTGGICLLDCDSDAACGTGRACDEGACVPAAGDAGSSVDPADGAASVSVGDFDDVSDSVDWDMPIESPPLPSVIAGGDARIVGSWLESGCDPASPPNDTPHGCVRLDVGESASGEIAGTLQIVRTQDTFGALPPVQDPDVGYPTQDPQSYLQLTNIQAGVPYRILDGRLESDRFTFTWSPYDLWHEWCALQTPHRWSFDDHAFSFCVPQDREEWSSIDEGKIVLCTSADFEPLCGHPSGGLVPCSCIPADSDPRCSPNYCQCDDSRCDANVRAIPFYAELSLAGDVMTGAFSSIGERWSANLARVSR